MVRLLPLTLPLLDPPLELPLPQAATPNARAPAAPAARAAAAAGSDPQRERPGRAKRDYGTSPHSISSKIGWGLMIGGMLVGKADDCLARWINCRRRISAVPTGASG